MIYLGSEAKTQEIRTTWKIALHMGGANRYEVIGGNAVYRHGSSAEQVACVNVPEYAAPQPYNTSQVVNDDGAALAPDQVGGYLARVEQLQQRLAKERISLPVGLEAFPHPPPQQEPPQTALATAAVGAALDLPMPARDWSRLGCRA